MFVYQDLGLQVWGFCSCSFGIKGIVFLWDEGEASFVAENLQYFKGRVHGSSLVHQFISQDCFLPLCSTPGLAALDVTVWMMALITA